jgi:hypothetical protein
MPISNASVAVRMLPLLSKGEAIVRRVGRHPLSTRKLHAATSEARRICALSRARWLIEQHLPLFFAVGERRSLAGTSLAERLVMTRVMIGTVARASRRALVVVLTVTGLFGVYFGISRPWFRNWGSTAAERQRGLPGDEALANATEQETRAITIAAPAQSVWAWLAQTGQDRGGFHSYELLEDLVGCEMENLDHIVPALGQWKLGDKLWMYPKSKLGGAGHAVLVAMEPGRALAFATRQIGTPLDKAADGTWTFVADPVSSDSTRLLIRGRAQGGLGLGATIFDNTVFESMHFAMERRMMEVIKARAEGRPVSRARDDVQVVLWFVVAMAGGVAAAQVLTGHQPRRRFAVLVVAGLLLQWLTFVQPTPLVGMPMTLALLLAGWSPRALAAHLRLARRTAPVQVAEGKPTTARLGTT